MPAVNTRHLLAGHGPHRARQPLTLADVAQRIASSIRTHAAQGIVRQATEYTSREETLAAVYVLLEGETSHA